MIREEVLREWERLKSEFLSELSKCYHDQAVLEYPYPNKPSVTCYICRKDLLAFEVVE